MNCNTVGFNAANVYKLYASGISLKTQDFICEKHVNSLHHTEKRRREIFLSELIHTLESHPAVM